MCSSSLGWLVEKYFDQPDVRRSSGEAPITVSDGIGADLPSVVGYVFSPMSIISTGSPPFLPLTRLVVLSKLPFDVPRLLPNFPPMIASELCEPAALGSKRCLGGPPKSVAEPQASFMKEAPLSTKLNRSPLRPVFSSSFAA